MRILLSDAQVAVIKKALLGMGDDAIDVRTHIESEEAKKNDENRKMYVKAAQEKHQKDGEIEIDDDAQVSEGEDSGAYVQAWIWISDDEAGFK